MSKIRPIHWLRSRQETSELDYWLTFVAYDQKDHTFLNRVYLLYLFLFFILWFFVVLVFFALVGSKVLVFLNESNTAQAAAFIELIVLAAWNLVMSFQSTRRSPLIFSEQDQSLVCQTPLDRRKLVLRWMWMPWLKSAVVFWLLALMLGFSVAETCIPAASLAENFFTYVHYGIKAWTHLLPVQLLFFILQWVFGVLRLQKGRQRNWIMAPVLAAAAIFLISALLTIIPGSQSLLEAFASPFQNTLMNGMIIQASSISILYSLAACLIALFILYTVSAGFHLGQAAFETAEVEMMQSAARYGFSDVVDRRRLQDHLEKKKSHSDTVFPSGPLAVLKKNFLQETRDFNWKIFFQLFSIFAITLGLPFLSNFWSRSLALLFWVVQIASFSVFRLRSDLACWTVAQQLPVDKKKLLILDLLGRWLLELILCTAALGLSSILNPASAFSLLLILPGLLATISFAAALDVLRRSSSDRLLVGSVPDTGTQGILFGLIGVFIPVFLLSAGSSAFGVLLSAGLSILISLGFLRFAVHFFKKLYTQ